MADKIKAVSAFRPRLPLFRMITLEDMEPVIAEKTTFNQGIVYSILKEFQLELIRKTMDGRSVKLEGLGVFTPAIDLEGNISIRYRMDKKLKLQVGLDNYKGEIKNRDMIGKSIDALIVRWNEENPADPITVTPTP